MLHNIRRIRSLLTQKGAQVLVQAPVISRLDSLLAGLPGANRPLQLIQNAAARLVFNLNLNSLTLLRSLHWLPVAARICFKPLVLVYRAATGSDPASIQDMVKPYTSARPLLSASANRLAAPSRRANHSSRKSTHLPPQTKDTSLPTILWIQKIIMYLVALIWHLHKALCSLAFLKKIVLAWFFLFWVCTPMVECTYC